ncbi:uncharacterized protein [Haliotis cracherodii]|uniref:uncharacterized protein n=1 Tax=Haliotis cracherodii TaxID=6455 RepID=UPI0039EC15DF
MSDFGKSNESKPAVEEVLLKLKKQKASAKTAFTKAKNKLYNMTEGKDVPTRRSVRDQMDQLCIVQEQAMEVMLMLSEEYSKNNDLANSKKLSIEIIRLEDETESAQQHAQQYLDCRSDASSVLSLRTGMSMLFNQKQEHSKSQKQECLGEQGKDVVQAQNESIKTFVRSEHELGQPKVMFTVVDWQKYGKLWTHLQDIDFPKIASPPIVDVLIGMDNSELHYSYSEYHTKGYIRKVPTEEMTNTGKWYLPHFPVVRLDRLTTKVRIVFDASAKYKGISLNEVIHQGPKLQRELFDVLLRFRRNPVALMSDIAEMYLQVKISPDDWPYHRFLWRSMKRDEQPTEYEFSRVVFGVNASPFLAQFVSQENAKKHQGDLPLAAETVQKATYMDDSMDSVEDDNTAIELYRQLVPRCLRCGHEVKETTLHSFVDASEDAYGAVVYAVNTYQNDEISRVIIAAKGRVAPLKAISIPRMDLMAAVTGLRLSVAITKALEVSIDIVTFWTDSSNVLSWIKNHSRTFKPFVANRVSEIQEVTNPCQWWYVPTAKNPADMLTRGIAASKLIDNQSWWSGPPFLTRDEGEWPQRLSEIESKKTCKLENETLKENKIITMVVNKSSCDEWRLKATRYSDRKRLARIQAWVYRFLNNCVAQNHQRISGELTAEEIETAQFKIIAKMQREEFPAEYSCLENRKPLPTNSKLLGLQPKLDECGVMRSDGRLAYAEHLSPESRFPIILPRRNWITRLIVKSYHEEGQHVTGTNQTLAALSAKFWILSGREEIREWERVCSQCRKQKAKVAHQIMAPLPEMRLTPSLRAFTQAGLDFAGPFFTVQGRGKARQKRYLCLFTCLASRAVHLEIAHGMDTNSFLNAFYRMASRRGLPEDIVCDNGTNFVGAEKELKELVSCLDNDAVKRTLANRGTKWKFNPPCAPHFGGGFETMIKAAKKAISAILGQSDVNDEELMTAFIGAEALINSRPLTYQTSHPQDDVPLTPNHFLHGQVGGSFAPESVDTTPFNPRKRWRRIQDLIRHFWSRWMKEWIPSLNRRRKWLTHQPDINVNDIVLLISPNTPRGHWPMGKVIKTHPGKDGYTRVVDIQIGQSVLTRPVTKVCPLETDSISTSG